MVTVRVTETYDLKTTKNKLGIIGIHTPNIELIGRLYPGFVKNHRFMRFRKCDVVGACASVLPADPLQVGVSSGTVAPEDLFNPILYKAVSNESFDTLVSRIYDTVNTSDVNDRTGSVNEQLVDVSTDLAFQTYYGLLSENGTWRKSMPQTGFRIKGLYPIAHTLLSQYGNVKQPHTGTFEDVTDALKSVPDSLGDVPFAGTDLTAPSSAVVTSNGLVFKGKPVKMPKFPLHYGTESIFSNATSFVAPPKTFVACMIIPPARLHEFYYRMRVTWTIDFIGVCSTLMYAGAGEFGALGGRAYGSDYSFAGAKSELPNESSTVDTDSVDVTKIMES